MALYIGYKLIILCTDLGSCEAFYPLRVFVFFDLGGAGVESDMVLPSFVL